MADTDIAFGIIGAVIKMQNPGRGADRWLALARRKIDADPADASRFVDLCLGAIMSDRDRFDSIVESVDTARANIRHREQVGNVGNVGNVGTDEEE